MTAKLAVPVRRVLALGFVAGFVDAFGFMDLHGVYTAAMTGNSTQVGVSVARSEWAHLALICATLGSFFAGSLIGSALRRILRLPALELLVMAGLLALAAGLRLALGSVPAIELPLLAIAMAMQGETVSRFGGMAIQTIVVTNSIIKFADGLVGSLTGAGTTSVAVVLPGCAWAAYTAGAVGGAGSAVWLMIPLLIPVVLLLLTAGDLLWVQEAD